MSGFKVNLSDFLKKTSLHAVKVAAATKLYADTAGKKLEAEAKSNAPWHDQTGNARNSIRGVGEFIPGGAAIILSGNVSYFKWLELAKGKKYAILFPTIRKNEQEILSAWAERVRAI